MLKPVRDYIDTLVHPSAHGDALATARHRAFIGPRLIGSSAALASFPAYLAMRGVPSALEIVVFAWLIAPILTAYFLSRTGRYESAHVLSSLALTGLSPWWRRTGGITSFGGLARHRALRAALSPRAASSRPPDARAVRRRP